MVQKICTYTCTTDKNTHYNNNNLIMLLVTWLTYHLTIYIVSNRALYFTPWGHMDVQLLVYYCNSNDYICSTPILRSYRCSVNQTVVEWKKTLLIIHNISIYHLHILYNLNRSRPPEKLFNGLIKSYLSELTCPDVLFSPHFS